MADNKWINVNGGNWGDGANWSLGHAPDATENAIIDASSFETDGKTITVNVIANMLDFDCSAADQLFTLTNAAYNFNVYGNLTLSIKLSTSFTGTGYLYLRATDSRNITNNGNTSDWNRIYMDGIGGEWTNQDDWFVITTIIYLANGTWNTFNKIVEAGTIGFQPGTKTWILGTSTIISRNSIFFHINGANLTFDCGTSTISVFGSSGSGLYTSSNSSILYNVITNNISASMNTVFNNLTYPNISGAIGTLYIGEYGGTSITINGVLNLSGNSLTNRAKVSGARGNQKTVICNGTLIAKNVDFADVKGEGVVNWDLSNIEGGSGDCGGNSDIIFTTAQQQWFTHTSGATNWSDSTKWFSNQIRTIVGRVPLPQDDAMFDTNSFIGTSSLTIDVPRICKNLDMSLIVETVTLSTNWARRECYGNFILGDNIITSGVAISLNGRGNFIFNSYGNTLVSITVDSVNGTYINASNINITTGYGDSSFYIISGTFDLNDFNLTTYGGIRIYGTLCLGNGIITIYTSGGQVMSNATSWPSIIIPENSIIKFMPTGANNPSLYMPKSVNLNKIWISGTHTGYFDFLYGSHNINELIIDPGRKIRFTNGTTQNIGKFVAIGTPEAPITITSTVTGTTHSLILTGRNRVNADYLNLSYSNVSPVNMWFAGLNSTNGNDNTGWIFDKAVYDARPFAYNPTHAIISGATLVGDISVGSDITDYSASPEGMLWWNGPDEYPGYIIAYPVPSGDRSTPIGNIGTIGFKASKALTEASFLELVKRAYGQTFANGADADAWLIANGYWSSFGRM